MLRGFPIWRGEPLLAGWLQAGPARAAAAALHSAPDLLFRKPEPRYATHVPLSAVQKGAVALLSLLGAAADPRRGDLVAAAGETTAGPALRALRDRMAASKSGRVLLAERPHVTNASVGHAWDLPASTFGGAYARFMGDRGFQADERPPVRFVDDAELAYVAARAREVHDFWHVLFGCHTDGFGEVALKALEFVQTGLPMTALAVVAGELRLSGKQREELNRNFLPWALQAGATAPDLICLHYEKHFEEDLGELRKRWRIIPAPAPPPRATRKAGGAEHTEHTEHGCSL